MKEREKQRHAEIGQCLAAHPDIFERCGRDGTSNPRGRRWRLRKGTEQQAMRIILDHLDASPLWKNLPRIYKTVAVARALVLHNDAVRGPRSQRAGR
jgi:hypothetical protein